MRDKKLMVLHSLSCFRKTYDTCVQDCMRTILMYLFSLEKEDARYNRHIYVVSFSDTDESNRKRIAIMCNLSPLESEDLSIMVKQYMESKYYPTVTMLIYDLKKDDLDQILIGDILSWIKNEFPHCKFTLTKEFLSSLNKDVNVYHYVLGK